MDGELWSLTAALFDRAIGLSRDERANYLQEACDNPSVLAEVESLLEAAEATGFKRLEDLVLRVTSDEEEDDEAPSSSRLGAYRLISEIGRGGMSRVYLARRSDDEFERYVAIKRIQTQLDSQSMRERFLSERQILAGLEHPNICRLYDGGTDDSGAPFLVMEYVAGGLPIDDFCEQNNLGLQQRLRLFCRVCEAVEFAHRNLVVHRDIKPANILVTADGDPRLLDFGIAKLLPSPGGCVTVTQLGTRALTPGFASPEQLQSKTVTTVSDVYSLGAVLYKLVSRSNALKADLPGRLQDIIEGSDPPAASSQAPGFGARLRGDLDAVLSMALRVAAEQRYATVHELRRDLENYLTGRPVAARKGTFRYRLGKFAKRQWLPLAATAALVALGSAFLWRSIEDASLLRKEHHKLRAVSDYLVDMLKTSSPEGEVASTETAQELVIAGAARVSASFASDPPAEAELQRFMGRVFENLGMYPEATAAHHRNLELLADFAPDDSSAKSRGLLLLARAQGKAGDVQQALQRSQEALQLGASQDPVVATQAHLVRGDLLWDTGKIHEALEVRRQALRLARALPESERLIRAQAMRDLAVNMMSMGEGAEAFELSQEALGLRQAELGADHPDLTSDFLEIASIEAGFLLDHKSALAHFNRASAILESYLPEDHPEVIAVRSRVAQMFHEIGQVEAAVSEAERIVELSKKQHGDDHPRVALELNNYGVFLTVAGRFEEAEQALRDALAIRNRIYPDGNSAWIAQSQYGLGNVLIEQERYALAAQHLEIAIRVMKSFPRRVAAIPLPDYARCLAHLGRASEAEAIAREGYERLAEAHPEGHRRVLIAQATLGSILSMLDRRDEAAPLLQESYSGLKEKLGAEHFYTQRVRTEIDRLEARPTPTP